MTLRLSGQIVSSSNTPTTRSNYLRRITFSGLSSHDQAVVNKVNAFISIQRALPGNSGLEQIEGMKLKAFLEEVKAYCRLIDLTYNEVDWTRQFQSQLKAVEALNPSGLLVPRKDCLMRLIVPLPDYYPESDAKVG